MARAVGQRVAQMPQAALLFFRQYFEIGHRRQQYRIPIDESLATIDQALVVQAHEHFRDGKRQICIHRKFVAGPVD